MERLEALDLPAEFETPLEKRAVMWTSPFVPVEPAELEGMRVRLRDLGYDTVYSPITRPYLLGLVALRLGHSAQALAQASQLESHAARQAGEGSSGARILAEYYATILRAQVAYDEGDAEGAFRLLEQAPTDDWWALRPAYLLLSQAHERFLRAQALEALGRDEEALRWYESFGWVSQADAPYVAPALLRVAEIYERLGDAEQAATYYRRFITRWADCDPELRPLVADAEQALARLTGDAEAP
jgi:tetratricopeptide (TPR) repeat protein